MKISDLKNMSMYQIRKIPLADKKALYTNIRRSVTQRANVFKRHDVPVQAPAAFRNMQPASELTDKMLNQMLSAAQQYYKGQTYTYSGFRKYHAEQKKNVERKMGIDLTMEQYWQYNQFMDDMAGLMKANWHFVSVQAAELFAQAQRLNLSTNQFKRNLDYWLDHADDLQYAKPITRGSGVKPSDYIKQLKLESITSWRTKQK